MQGVVFVIVFPLSFIAATFVPLDGFHGVLRSVADANPLSCFATAARSLFGNPTGVPHDAGWPLVHPVLSSQAWCLALLGAAVPATVWAYRRRTTG